MAIVTVNVTQDCIDRGEREDCDKCPVALAMLHAGFIAPRVDGCSLGWMEPSRGRVYVRTPDDVAFFIDELDGNDDDADDPGPFSFPVDTDAAESVDESIALELLAGGPDYDYSAETP